MGQAPSESKGTMRAKRLEDSSLTSRETVHVDVATAVLRDANGFDHNYVYRQLRTIKFIVPRLKREVARQYLAAANAPTADLASKVDAERVRTSKRAELLQIAERISADINQHIEVHVLAPQCLALCERMQTELPQELRDFVYDYLLHGSKVDIKKIENRFNARKNSVHLPDEPVYARLLMETCADPCTRSEFVHSWYRSTTFRFAQDAPFREFLRKDYWRFGYKVPSLIRNVELVDLVVPTATSPNSFELEVRSNLDDTLKVLSSLKSGAHIRLSFPLTARQQVMFGDLMSEITHVVDELRTKGYKISIKRRNSSDIEIGTGELTDEYWSSLLASGV